MIIDPIRRRYGAGALGLPLAPPPRRSLAPEIDLVEGFGQIWHELRRDARAVRQHVGGSAAAVSFCLLLLWALGTALWHGQTDDSPVQIVAWQAEAPAPEPVRSDPEQWPDEPLPVEPEPVPEPPQIAQPEPPPPPPPKPVPVPRPALPPPPPRPETSVAERAPRPPAPRPEPRRAPVLAIDALPKPAVRPETQLARADVRPASPPRPTMPRPQLAAVRAPVERAPAPDRAPTHERLAPRPARSAPPRPAFESLRAPTAAPETRSEPRFRRAQARASTSSRPAPTAPSFDLAAPPAGAASAAPTTQLARARVTARTGESGRAVARPAGLSAPVPSASPGTSPAAPGSGPSRRPVRAAREGASGSGQRRSGLRGVPLGSLAACRSERLEDSLKQKVIAAVTTQAECVSGAGIYRFIETRNLNAFLMYVERTGGAAAEDRCGELENALRCLSRSSGASAANGGSGR